MNESKRETELLREELRAVNNRLAHLAKSASSITVCARLKERAPHLLKEFARNMSAEGGSLYLCHEDRLTLVCTLDPGHVPKRIDFPLREGTVFERIMREKQPILIPDMEREGELIRSGWTGYKNQSFLGFPLPDETGRILGILCLHNKTTPPFTPQDRKIGTVLASLTCEALRTSYAMARLRKSEERFQQVAENAQEAIWEVDANGLYTYISPGVERILGWKPKAVVGKKHFFDFFLPEERDELKKAAFEVFRKGESFREFPNRNLHKEGHVVWVLTSGVPILDGEGQLLGYRGADIDITERRTVGERQEAIIEGLRKVVGFADELIAHADLNDLLRRAVEIARGELGLERCAIFLKQNHELRGTYGTDLQGHTTDEHDNVIPFGEKQREQHFQSLSPDGRRWDVTHKSLVEWDHGRLARVGEGWVVATLIQSSNELVGYLTNDSAITRAPLDEVKQEVAAVYCSLLASIITRKRAEEELLEKNEFIQTVTDNLPIGLAVHTMGDGLFQYMNRRFEECYGITHETTPDVDAFWVQTFHDPEFRKGIEERVLNDVRSGDPARMRWENLPITDETGETRYVSAMNIPLTKRNLMISTVWDVTERRVLEEQLRQAQKLEAVGQLAGGIAHDFNNILQAIFGYTEMARSGLAPTERRAEDLDQVKKGAERAAKLTQQLLAFSRRQMIQPQDIDLNGVITDLSKMLHRVIGEHIELDLKLGQSAGSVHADPGTLEQVLMNLCVNARDAMPGGGQLVIETRHVVLDDAFAQAHPGVPPGKYALLSVTDTGDGMEAETVEHIFEPFFTTKDTGKGTGLGLSMVYGIIKQHRGLIDCQSERNKGTCFNIYLPSIERTTAATENGRKTSTPDRGTETILFAEDEEMVRDLALRILENQGYRVLVARDGADAIRMFEMHRDEIDFALLDVVMPKVGGREVHDTIQALKPDMPVLFSSGYSASAIHSGFIVQKGLETIQKPYSPNDLLQKVREMLDAR